MYIAVPLLSWLRMMTCLEDSVLMKVEIWDKKEFEQFGTLEFEIFNLYASFESAFPCSFSRDVPVPRATQDKNRVAGFCEG